MSALGSASFAAAMRAFAPFEPKPRVAVAVSGGADSTALAIFTDRWARARGGDAIALTVDHRLRTESTTEARTVGRWLKSRDIRHVRLTWRHEETSEVTERANLQARARGARYRLMSDWCVRNGILHLLVAHHRDDQAETLLLRLARGSGVDGLAAMAPVVHTGGVRILRPLLGWSREGIETALHAMGQPWIDDPSNRNAHFARVRVRALRAPLAAEGLTGERLAETAARLRRARASLETATAEVLAWAATPSAEGFVRLDRDRLLGAPEEIALRVLARLVAAVGGCPYVPRREGTERLLRTLAAAPTWRVGSAAADRVAATLGGTLIVAERDGAILAVREPAAVAGAVALVPTGECRWDGRFQLRVRNRGTRRFPAVTVGALGESGARRLLRDRTAEAGLLMGIPRRARPTLPALFDAEGRLIGLPIYPFDAYGRGRSDADSLAVEARFAPALPLVGPGFMLV